MTPTEQALRDGINRHKFSLARSSWRDAQRHRTAIQHKVQVLAEYLDKNGQHDLARGYAKLLEVLNEGKAQIVNDIIRGYRGDQPYVVVYLDGNPQTVARANQRLSLPHEADPYCVPSPALADRYPLTEVLDAIALTYSEERS